MIAIKQHTMCACVILLSLFAPSSSCVCCSVKWCCCFCVSRFIRLSILLFLGVAISVFLELFVVDHVTSLLFLYSPFCSRNLFRGESCDVLQYRFMFMASSQGSRWHWKLAIYNAQAITPSRPLLTILHIIGAAILAIQGTGEFFTPSIVTPEPLWVQHLPKYDVTRMVPSFFEIFKDLFALSTAANSNYVADLNGHSYSKAQLKAQMQRLQAHPLT